MYHRAHRVTIGSDNSFARLEAKVAGDMAEEESRRAEPLAHVLELEEGEEGSVSVRSAGGAKLGNV